VLYTAYARREALSLLDGGEPAKFACDGQIAIARSTIAWLSEPPEGSFPEPSAFRWAASQRYEEASGEWWFLPAEVRDHRRRYRIHLFFDPESSDHFVYVGGAHLASYGFTDCESLGEVSLALERKLPREVWLWFGGYDGWSVTIDGNERRGLESEEAVHLVRDVFRRGSGEVSLTRYEEDSLAILVEARRAMLLHLAFPGDSGRVTRDPGYGWFIRDCALHALEWPGRRVRVRTDPEPSRCPATCGTFSDGGRPAVGLVARVMLGAMP
jgi:hypothetical protein